MKIRDILSFGAFAAMVAFAIAYIGSFGVRVAPPANRADLTMSVADVNGLVAGSKVLLRGVPVGAVTHVDSAVDGGTVHFYIADSHHVPVDTDVRLENLSALGESYISLAPRTAAGPMLRNGQRISAESVTQPPSISELATSIVRVLNQLDPEALRRITQEADTALPEANSVLPNLTRTSKLLRNTAADMNGRGQALLDNFQTLLANAGWLGPLLSNLTPQLSSYNPHLRDLFATFPALIGVGAPEPLYKFDAFLGRIQKLLDNNGGDLRVIGNTFQPKLTGIAGSLLNFDTGQILTNLLDAVPPDGAITLHVNLENN